MAFSARGLSSLIRRRVVVHTKDDQSIRGVLLASHKDCLIVGHPEYLGAARESVDQSIPLPKTESVVVLRTNVSWMQILEG